MRLSACTGNRRRSHLLGGRLLLLVLAAAAGLAPVRPRQIHGPQQARVESSLLTRQGDHFAIDGRGEFLLFVSYFDGLNRQPALLRRDLAWLAANGVRGIRVWPNSPPVPLMHADGTLSPAMLDRLGRLVGEAARFGIVVDVTFHREAIDCPDSACAFSVTAYGAALAQAARALSAHRNVLIDLQNEWNDHRIDMSWPDIESLRTHYYTSKDLRGMYPVIREDHLRYLEK